MLSVLVGLSIVMLLCFLYYQNRKDEKKFERDLNEKEEHPLRPPTEDEKHI
jgi:hypothetical protein